MSGLRGLLHDAAAGPAVRADFGDVVRRGRRARRRRVLAQATAAASVIALALTTLGGAGDERVKTTTPVERPAAEEETTVEQNSAPTPPGGSVPKAPVQARRASGPPAGEVHGPGLDARTPADRPSPHQNRNEPPSEDTAVLFIRDNELFVMRPDGSEVRQLTNDGARKEHASWSPDGSKAVVSISRSDVVGSYAEIWVIDIATGGGTRLAGAPNEWFRGPQWSPDGRSIVFWVSRGLDVDDPRVVMRMDADGSNLVELAPGSSPSWSPDGLRILYTCQYSLCTMAADGSGNAEVPHSGGLDHATLSPDGHWIAAIDGSQKLVTVMRSNGTDQAYVGSGPVQFNPPAWLSTTRIVYALKPVGGSCCDDGAGLYTASLEPVQQQRLTTAEDTVPSVRRPR
jgi:hypothetical protein